ncbi:MAG: hypothetical protein LBC87_09485 [Fibromonadaceae bacterium]|jgi:hypothetical protein|nr:hypothetical protein [Fibromonadaceae bacterium]
MRTKKSLLALLLLAATSMSMFLGCGKHDPYVFDRINWNGDSGGSLEIINGSNKDIVLFIGQVPATSTIMGGAKAGKTTSFDPGKYVGEAEYGVGGWTVIRGITKEKYDENFDLSKATVEYMAMATYRKGTTYRIQIDGAYLGDYGFKVTNRGQIGMELRRNSPEGEKVSYLPALQVNQIIYAETSNGMTLFPVYVFFNKKTGEVSTLKATSMKSAVDVSPRSLMDETKLQSYTFPDNSIKWEDIIGDLKDPVAYITVTNNVRNQSAYFTNAGSTDYWSQNGYNTIGSGETLVFEVEGGDVEGGTPRMLIAQLRGRSVDVPIRFENENVNPRIENGYNYEVEFTFSGGDPLESSSYTATIIKGEKRKIDFGTP